MRSPIVAFALLLIVPLVGSLSAQSLGQDPTLSGRVTAIHSAHDLEVNGIPILVTPTTRIGVEEKKHRTADERTTATLGQVAHIYGKLDRKHHTLTATYIWLVAPPSGDGATVAGLALIDLLPPSPSNLRAGELLIRADGLTASSWSRDVA